jgi:hypothetical protein
MGYCELGIPTMAPVLEMGKLRLREVEKGVLKVILRG